MDRPSVWRVTRGRRVLYCLLQALGWGTYFGYSEVWIVVGKSPRPLIWIWPIIMLLHVAASHVLRAAIKAKGWVGLPARRLLPRLAATIFLLCIAIEIPCLPLAVLSGIGTIAAQLRGAILYTAASFVLLSVWAGLYFGFQYSYLYRDAELQRLRLEAGLRRAELLALKSQVNPHFLFNCLNNLKSLVVEDGERARDMLTRLSELLRHALESTEKERVPLQDELHVVEAYLELQKMQFEERLRWSIQVSPDAWQAGVPPMLVQQLVENAIKHGITKLPRGGDVAVTVRDVAEGVEIRVENTGELGIISGNGVGLINARERLSLLCGANASLSLESVPGGRVAATALIPA